jgi:hypothetical protein
LPYQVLRHPSFRCEVVQHQGPALPIGCSRPSATALFITMVRLRAPNFCSRERVYSRAVLSAMPSRWAI